jgi:hypothetical protein
VGLPWRSHALRDAAALDVERIPKPASTAFALQLFIRDLAGCAFKAIDRAWLMLRIGQHVVEGFAGVGVLGQGIAKGGEARFERIEGLASGVQSGVRDRLGWRKGEGAKREWWVPAETWKTEFCDGLDPTFAACTLAARGMLRRQDAKHIQCTVALGDKQQEKCLSPRTLVSDDPKIGSGSC